MNLFIESLKRLYRDNRITTEVLERLFFEGKIDECEKDYILGKEE